MNVLEIRTLNNQTQFLPEDVLEGTFEWALDGEAKALELRLIWFTQGKGDADVSVEDTRRFEAPPRASKAAFRFVLPAAPYSFSGKLISLCWALELVVMPGEDATRLEFSLSPTGAEILLPQEANSGDFSKNKIPAWMQSKLSKTQTGNFANHDEPSVSTLRQSNPFDK